MKLTSIVPISYCSVGATGSFCSCASVAVLVALDSHSFFERCHAMLRTPVRVAHGHCNGLVAQQLLNGPDVYSSHHQAACEGVTQIVPGEVYKLRVLHGVSKPARLHTALQ